MNDATVFIVDDNQTIREALGWLLRSVGLHVEAFESAESFLAAYSVYRGGCLVLDVRMPGMSGLQLQEELNKHPYPPPIVFISGHGDVSMVVRAMKAGAIDFIEKPFNDQELLDVIQHALRIDVTRCKQRQLHDTVKARLENLTQREHQVLELISERCSNKEIAQRLSISIKTVEYHRAKLMEKMHAGSMLDLMEMLRDFESIYE